MFRSLAVSLAIACKFLCLLPIGKPRRPTNQPSLDGSLRPNRTAATSVRPTFVSVWTPFPVPAVNGQHSLAFSSCDPSVGAQIIPQLIASDFVCKPALRPAEVSEASCIVSGNQRHCPIRVPPARSEIGVSLCQDPAPIGSRFPSRCNDVARSLRSIPQPCPRSAAPALPPDGRAG